MTDNNEIMVLQSQPKFKVGIVGATGYTGIELIRLLSAHPQVDLIWLTSRSEAGTQVADIFPSLRGITELKYQDFGENSLTMMTQADVVFFATPHGVAMKQTPALVKAGVKVIDLGADFRLQSLTDFEHWYAHSHSCPELLQEAIYGLTEVNRNQLSTAKVVGNPGCYPTTALLGLNPIIQTQNRLSNQLIEKNIVIDAKSGVSGAGRQAKLGLNYCETTDNFRAYGVTGHRHLPEIEQGIALHLDSKFEHQVRFLPHLVPMIRGMFSSIHLYMTEAGCQQDWQSVFEKVYKSEPFIDVMPSGDVADTRSVRGSNRLRISIVQNNTRRELTIMVVQDNLVKGAAGQAIQNMNVMLGLKETMGLLTVPMVP